MRINTKNTREFLLLSCLFKSYKPSYKDIETFNIVHNIKFLDPNWYQNIDVLKERLYMLSIIYPNILSNAYIFFQEASKSGGIFDCFFLNTEKLVKHLKSRFSNPLYESKFKQQTEFNLLTDSNFVNKDYLEVRFKSPSYVAFKNYNTTKGGNQPYGSFENFTYGLAAKYNLGYTIDSYHYWESIFNELIPIVPDFTNQAFLDITQLEVKSEKHIAQDRVLFELPENLDSRQELIDLVPTLLDEELILERFRLLAYKDMFIKVYYNHRNVHFSVYPVTKTAEIRIFEFLRALKQEPRRKQDLKFFYSTSLASLVKYEDFDVSEILQ